MMLSCLLCIHVLLQMFVCLYTDRMWNSYEFNLELSLAITTQQLSLLSKSEVSVYSSAWDFTYTMAEESMAPRLDQCHNNNEAGHPAGHTIGGTLWTCTC